MDHYCDVLATYSAFQPQSDSNVLATYSSRRHTQRVEDRLLEIQRQYMERIEARRHQKEELEELGITGSPSINRRSKDLAGPRSRQATFDRLAVGAPAIPPPPPDVDGSSDHRPLINKNSAKLQRSVEAQFEWERNRTAKLEIMRAELERRDVVGATFAPMLDPKSRVMAQSSRTNDAPVEDLLLQKQREHEEKLEAERRRIVRESKGVKSQSLDSAPAGAADRLYSDAQERLRLAEEAARVQDLLRVVDTSGQILFRPSINKSSSSGHSGRSEDLFTHLSKPSRTAVERPPAAESHRPAIGTYSALLAKLHNMDSSETVVERLAKPKPIPEPSAPSPSSSFRPSINKRSEHLDAQSSALISGECNTRADLLLRRQRLYDAHRERLLREKENSELAQVKTTPRRTKTPTRFFERSQAWSKRNEARLAAQREAMKDVDLEGCTFKPQTRH